MNCLTEKTAAFIDPSGFSSTSFRSKFLAINGMLSAYTRHPLEAHVFQD
jgi:hypothetical protein